MRKYITKRLLLIIPMLFAISFIAFLLINFMPSDPAEVALRVNEIVPTDEAIEAMRIQLGLDKPFFIRYFNWIIDCLHLDFGISYTNTTRTVLSEITRCLPYTIKLSLMSLVIVVFVSIPVGVFSAIYKNSFFDKIVRILVFIGSSMPSYLVGIIFIYFFSVKFKLLPSGGATGFKNFILPAIALSLTEVSTYVRLIRSSVLDNMNENYVFYGKVRGLRNRIIILKHVLKNSLKACMNAFGMSIAYLIAGAFVIENVFA
ncbi:MAG: ABC transporter permease, partial [Clostridium perfringens]|nr:ABC transporter permease [Clostridium perfringens]